MQPMEELYRLYSRELYRYLLTLARDPTLAEDLLSETFLYAIRGLGSFRGDSAVKTWLFGIARNRYLTHLRKRVHSGLDEAQALDWGVALEEQAVTRQAAARLLELLAGRDERTRNAVLLRAQGYSYAEIGEKLKLSENSARVIVFRARTALRDALTREGLL
ncbi:RNA polymerase sigma factor [Feifania hominis]|uniref:Sigma-70 family RNA polymerase sigma factor n=1 Tax=Feifania hominis TaxID=2763660 RepID=A0A926DEI6_9FIRM|nr:sigma-70 family RNA polymerase sigma factor [Feifania hominis]MBC8536746.1 sigma-70 family RNA polymerase sigma factor [Feifania hominis]